MTTATKSPATLQVSSRDKSGKGVARALRREGKVPGTIYGKGQKPYSIALSLNELTQEYGKGRFRSRLVTLKLDGKDSVKALPKDLQFNPVTDVIEHVDFIKVEAGTNLRVMIPVKVVGQDKSVGLKRGGVLNIVRHEIEFTCAPESIPTSIEVNVQAMDIGSSLHIQSVELPKGITPVIKRNFTVVTVAGRSKEEEEVKVTTTAATDATAAAAPGTAGAAAPAAGAAATPAAGAAKKEEKKK